jgi:heat-inducible transcriptional repressor
VREALLGQDGGVEDILRTASRLLSSLSHYAGVVLAPRPLRDAFRRVDFVRIRPGAVLVILVSSAGAVQNRLVEGGEDHSQDELDRMARTLNERFPGVALSEMRRRVLEEMRADKDDYDRRLREALLLSGRAFEQEGREDLMVEGSANILEVPEFAADLPKMRQLFRAFEEKGRLVELLDRAMRADGLTVAIGSEARLPGMADVSLVAAAYGGAGAPLGTLGIIGPTRMAYSHVIPLVEATARALSERLSAARGAPAAGAGGTGG